LSALLDLEDLHVRRGRVDVVRGVGFTIERGETVAVLGPNGSGKSTLLETVAGLLEPQSGRLERHGRIATVLQSPGLANRSVLTNIELALAWWGTPRNLRRQRAMAALEQMRALHLAKQHAATLSGGERRRVHVARGVALRPDLLLLDEPFAGLDAETRAALCEDTNSALRSSESGVLLVVHDRDDAWALADRLVVMIDGRIAASGEPAELLAKPPTVEVARFLGYDGELRRNGGAILTRPPHVLLAEDGDIVGRVERLLPQQDGTRIEISTDNGNVRAFDSTGLVTQGSTIRFRLVGGAHFDTGNRPPA
jgi:ABC-type sugar transport system ATPase subunit